LEKRKVIQKREEESKNPDTIFTFSLLASVVELIPYIDDNIGVPLVVVVTFEIFKRL